MPRNIPNRRVRQTDTGGLAISEILSRPNHTGKQTISTIDGLQTTLDGLTADNFVEVTPSANMVTYFSGTSVNTTGSASFKWDNTAKELQLGVLSSMTIGGNSVLDEATTGAVSLNNISALDSTTTTTLQAEFPRSLFKNTSDATTSGTTAESLYSNSISAGTLATNGDSVKGRYWGIYAANANNKQISIDVGGLAIDFFTSTGNDTVWHIQLDIIRTSDTTIKMGAFWNGSGLSGDWQYTAGTVSSLTSTALVVDLQGTTSNQGGDLTAKLGVLEYVPA